MPEIEFSIDTETGDCRTEIRGIRGPACERAARELKLVIGEPTRDEKTREYFAAEIKRTIKCRKR